MKILWQESAWEEYLYWQLQDKKTLKRINKLLMDINRNGYQCIGKPEPLKGDFSGSLSIRLFHYFYTVRQQLRIYDGVSAHFHLL